MIFDCEDFRYKEQDFRVAFTLDDLAETVSDITITYTVGDTVRDIVVYEVSSDARPTASCLRLRRSTWSPT